MINQIELAEKQIERFLPLIKKNYPTGRKDISELKEWISKYEDMTMSDNVVIALFDHKTQSLFFISENVEQLSGYKKKTILNWGSLLFFKAFNYSHYSYAFKALKWALHFHKNTSFQHKKNIKLYSSGLKMWDNKRDLRNAFLKRKTLILDEKNMPDISIVFLEEVTHLVKGNHYWIRLISPESSFGYVNKKGNKIIFQGVFC